MDRTWWEDRRIKADIAFLINDRDDALSALREIFEASLEIPAEEVTAAVQAAKIRLALALGALEGGDTNRAKRILGHDLDALCDRK